MRLGVKFALMGASGVMITAIALVTLAVWQGGQYNQLAQKEVDGLIDADLDHITQGVYHLVRTENEAVQQQVDYNLNVARHLLASAGNVSLSPETIQWTAINQFTNESVELNLPKLIVGETWLGQNRDLAVNTPIVDEVTQLVGETATIFQRMNEKGDMLRIATTVENSANQRAISTYIPAVNPDGADNPVISAILNGKTYHGRAYVVNAWYLTAYEPIKDAAGVLAGMLYVGVKQKAVESRVRHAILQTKVGKTGYVYVLGGGGEDKGRYIISYKGERDGEDIWTNVDSDGRYVIQEIISKATALKPGEMTTVRYRWQNLGESEPRWKIARLAYYAPWDWVIGTSVYEDELQTYRAWLTSGRQRMIRVMSVAGAIITILVGMTFILLTWSITRPIRQMTDVAEKVIGGDFDQAVNVKSHDEIGVLAKTFNLMTSKIKQSMVELRQSEEKYRGIFENTPEGLFRTTIDGRILNANPAMTRILGYDSPEELNACVTDIGSQVYVHSKMREQFIAELIKHGKIENFENQLYRKDKSIIWVSIGARLSYDENGRPHTIEGFITNITARKQAEEALAESRNYLGEIINTVADPVFVKDREHRWVLVNNAMCAFMGHSRDEILGKSDYDYSPKEEADVFWSKDELVLTTGQENLNEEHFTDVQGAVHTLVTKKALYTDKNGEKFIVGIIRDITDRKKVDEEKRELEARLTQAQKMEAIGTLAGGIAHDFNNILSAIIGFSELAMHEIQNKEKSLNDMKEVIKAGDRAKELVKQILTFSRMTETKYMPVSLDTVVKESLTMLRSVIPSTIEIKHNLAASGQVMSDPTQINQIMLNLCTNAVHAMEEGGVLEVELSEATIDENAAQRGLELAPGPYLKLTIRDTGTGMPAEVMGRIFEPYYTTKELGRGTGLGLSVIHGIVKSHNGAIACTSAVNAGTTFEVYLPKIETKTSDENPSGEIQITDANERILFVDDEKILANLTSRMLINSGYKVVAKTDSVEALELFRENPRAFDLVITDMTMPRMTGDQLTQEIIAIRHDMPVILCTGYNERISEERAKEIGVREFVLKPWNLKTLTAVVKKTLNSRSVHPSTSS
ncbi:Cache 3/Cache 2 fusion domain-containing protein [Candidatus Sumerlaeota bacterium]|nr:Cache 3/Cache 2 fusion domain-containing protein [Candidatus Sumerlaeota bacterium]